QASAPTLPICVVAGIRVSPFPFSERSRGMNRDPILFRVDGTTATGLERLARCLTLAAALQRRRRPTYFLSQLEPASLALAIKRAGNDWLEPDGPAGSADDVEETIQEVRRLQAAARSEERRV